MQKNILLWLVLVSGANHLCAEFGEPVEIGGDGSNLPKEPEASDQEEQKQQQQLADSLEGVLDGYNASTKLTPSTDTPEPVPVGKIPVTQTVQGGWSNIIDAQNHMTTLSNGAIQVPKLAQEIVQNAASTIDSNLFTLSGFKPDQLIENVETVKNLIRTTQQELTKLKTIYEQTARNNGSSLADFNNSLFEGLVAKQEALQATSELITSFCLTPDDFREYIETPAGRDALRNNPVDVITKMNNLIEKNTYGTDLVKRLYNVVQQNPALISEKNIPTLTTALDTTLDLLTDKITRGDKNNVQRTFRSWLLLRQTVDPTFTQEVQNKTPGVVIFRLNTFLVNATDAQQETITNELQKLTPKDLKSAQGKAQDFIKGLSTEEISQIVELLNANRAPQEKVYYAADIATEAGARTFMVTPKKPSVLVLFFKWLVRLFAGKPAKILLPGDPGLNAAPAWARQN